MLTQKRTHSIVNGRLRFQALWVRVVGAIPLMALLSLISAFWPWVGFRFSVVVVVLLCALFVRD